MSEVTNAVGKVYSTDQKLWVNMTREEAYKLGRENLELFNFADKNDDQKLDTLEITRYNSPVVVENYEEASNSRIITNGRIDNRSLFVGNSIVNLGTTIITNTEEEFYAGLKLEQVSKKGTEKFYAMDLDNNGELSPEEMEQAAEIKNRLTEALGKVKEQLVNNCKKSKCAGWLSGIGVGVGLTAIVGVAECELIAGLALGGPVGIAVGLGVLGATYFIGRAKKHQNLEKTFQEAMGGLMSHPYAEFAKETFMKTTEEFFK